MADRSVSVWLKANVDGYLASIKKAQLTTSDFAKTAQKDAAAHSAAFDKVGKTMLVTGGVIAAGLALAVKASMEFRAQMAQVQSLSGATASQMKQLSDAALTVGQRFGFTAKQVAEAETELVKAGLSVKDILGGALTGALTLAADGQMNVADATQIAVSAMTQFKLTGKDVPHVADLLAAGADKALGSVGDLGSALSSSGTVAHQFGWNLQETVGTLSEFAQNAQIGEKGGTLLRQMLLQLVNPSTQASAIMDKYGLSISDANGAMVSSSVLAGRLQKSFGGLTPAVRNHALAVIFGAHAIQGANILMSDGAKVNAGWVSTVNDAGFAAKQAAGKMDSLQGDLSKLKASFETGLIKTGDEATGTLRGLVKGLTAVTSWYDNLSDSSRAMVTETALVVGGITLVGGAALVALPKIVAFQKALAELGITGGRVIAPLAGAAGAEGAVGAGAAGGAGAGAAAGAAGGGLLAKFGGVGVAGVSGLKALPLLGVGAQSDKLKSPAERAAANFGAEHPNAGKSGFGDFVAKAGSDKSTMAQLKAYESETYKVKSSADAAAGSTRKLTVATAAVGSAAWAASLSVGDWSDALKAANQPTLDSRSAARDYQAALDGVTESIKQNGHSLDTNTPKGRANQAALDAVAAAANNAAAANRANGESLPKVNAQLEVARGQLYDMARKFGLGKDAAHAYVNQVLGIPGKADTQVTLAGIKAAKQAAHDLKVWLQNELGVINVQARVRASVGKGVPVGSANGNIFYANGGMENHVAQIAGAGMNRIWAEPETGGEAYIPFATSKRGRSTAILGQVAQQFGYGLYSSGGMSGGSSSAATPAWPMPDTITLVDSDGTFLARMRTVADGRVERGLKTQNRQISSGVR